MRDCGGDFRRRARARGLGRVGARYPKELRELAVSIWQRAAQAGQSRRQVAVILGLPVNTLRRWIAGEAAGAGADAMAEVRVSGAVSMAAPVTSVVITPRGYRVEGLSIAELAQLLAALG